MEHIVYCIWNNKGGVGKTFLSFTLASVYAQKNPDKKVFVVDTCPQANLSEIILGGNSSGAVILEKFINQKKTLGGYFDSRIRKPHEKTGSESGFIIQTCEYNKHLPKNLYLIAGDPSLEIQAQVMNQISSLKIPNDSWKSVHLWVKDIIGTAQEHHGGNTTTFIDCNPSFSAYTELSIIASNKLIVPCTSDGSSARAINNLFFLIYGLGRTTLQKEYEDVSFAKKSETFNLSKPILHSVLLNRSTQYEKKASKAFGAVMKEIRRRVESIKTEDSKLFHSDFDYYDIPDAHSVAIVSSYQGKPITQISHGIHEVHGTRPQINKENLDRHKKAIDEFVLKL